MMMDFPIDTKLTVLAPASEHPQRVAACLPETQVAAAPDANIVSLAATCQGFHRYQLST